MNTHSISKPGRARVAASAVEAPPSTPALSLGLEASGGRRTRSERRPFGSHNQKLKYPQRDGYHRHWFNDDPGRIEDALAAGYEHVLDDKGGRVPPRPVGVKPDGSTLMAYIMETPEEWFLEDMAAQQRTVDETESALRRGVDKQGEPGKDGRYIPSQGIRIETR